MARICGFFMGLFCCLMMPQGVLAQGTCTGWIAVESTPEEGGAILLDGKDTGKKTPATLKGISCGQHTVELKKPHFVGDKQIVGVASGEVVKARVTLVANYASVEIATDPKGAEIQIDGRKAGKSPIKIKRLDAGTHTLKVKLPDYHDTVRKFKLRAGKPLSLNIKLLPAFGSIQIIAKKVKEAEVYVDGDALGTTPISLKRVISGPHTIRVVKEGYKPYKTRVNIKDGKQTTVVAALKPNYGTLLVTSKPTGANVAIDKKPRGKTPLTVRLEPGEHAVVVSGATESYGTEERTVRIRLRKKHKLKIKLSAKTGSLMIDTIPFAAQIELDGKVRGRAPLSLKTVPIGTHVIIAKLEGKPPLIGRIDVLEGQAAVAEMNLNKPEKSVYKSGGRKKSKSAPRPKPVPVSKPAPKPEPKPVVKAAPKPEPKPEPRPALKPEPKPIAKTEHPSSAPPLTTVSKSTPMSTQEILAWSAAGTGAALVVTSVVLFVVAASKISDADDFYQNYLDERAKQEPDLARLNYFRDRFTELDDQAAALNTGGVVCVIVGGLAAGASVFLFLYDFDGDSGSSTAVRFNPMPGGAWVGIEGRF